MTASIADYQNATPKSSLNISVTTVVKAAPGGVFGLAILSGTAPGGSINDCAGTGAVAASNQVASIPSGANVLGAPTQTFEPPLFCLTGITVTPPAGGAVSVFFA